MRDKSIFQQLKSVKDINKDHTKTLNDIFKSFLKDDNSPFKSDDKYYIKASTGQGNIATIWWCAIFDLELYKECYKITKKSNIGASKGYYIVYLFNENKNVVYLSLNQAAKDITKKKNMKLLEFVKSSNEYIRTELSKDRIYLRDITGLLSEYGKDLAPDYEQGNILSIEYDLNKDEIDDAQFFDGLNKIKIEYDSLKEMMITNQGILKNKIKNEEYNLIKRCILTKDEDSYIEDIASDFIHKTYSSKVISDKEAEEKSNRPVKYNHSGAGKRVITDSSLRKYVLEKEEYKCQYNNMHHTFLTSKKKIQYMEVHHLIPLEFQKLFGDDYTLDRVDNLVVLCPICHRAIHYGLKQEKERILKPLYEQSKMKEVLKEKQFCYTFEEFMKKFYKVPKV